MRATSRSTIAAVLTVALLEPSAAGAAKPEPKPKPVEIAWVGDMTLGSRYGRPPAGGMRLFDAVRGRLRAPDATLGNLEGTFGAGGPSKCGLGAPNCFAFQAPSRNARALAAAGFDLVNVANNHFNDFGTPGQAMTVRALRRAGVAYTGRPGQIRYLRVAGRRVAVVGFAPYPWAAPLRGGPAAALVRRAARRSDLVVALMHAGAEGAARAHTPRGAEFAFGEFRGKARAFSRGLVRAGADAVLGSGPHVLRGIERYRGRVIAYSLANFAGVRNFDTSGVLALTGILTLRFDARDRVSGGRFASVRLVDGGRPVPDGSGAARRFVNALSRSDFGRRAVRLRQDGSFGARP